MVRNVDGVKFSAGDLQRKGSGPLFEGRRAVFGAERKAAEDLVGDYLLERQAKKENLSVEALLKKHVDDTIEKNSKLRDFSYDGASHNRTPHVKVRDYAPASQVGRIHFALDSDNARLIVDHVGLKLY